MAPVIVEGVACELQVATAAQNIWRAVLRAFYSPV